MKLGLLCSSGKDSILAMHKAVDLGHSIECLISIESENPASWMFHTPNIKHIELIAKALDIPVVMGKTAGEKELELEDLKITLQQAKQQFHIDGIVSGAIKSRYQWTRIDKIAADLELMSLAPLWDTEQDDILSLLDKYNMDVIIVHIAADCLNKAFLGRHIGHTCIKDLKTMHEKTKMHIAGEGGEYETFCLDAKLFKKKIVIDDAEINMENPCTGSYDITKAHLEEK